MITNSLPKKKKVKSFVLFCLYKRLPHDELKSASLKFLFFISFVSFIQTNIYYVLFQAWLMWEHSR